MSEYEKIIAKLRKIKALAYDGIDGEKESASIHYQRMLSKYGLSESDIDGTEKNKRLFVTSTRWQLELLCQIAALNTDDNVIYRAGKNTRNAVMYLTDIDFINITELYQWHKKHYQKDLRNVLSAFRYKYFENNDLLLPTDEPIDEPIDVESKYSNDEINAINAMSDIVGRDNFSKSLNL